MDSELSWLVYTLAVTALFPFPYVLNRIAVQGVRATLGNPQASGDAALAPWAQRAKRAHANAVENLVLFAPAVVALQFTGGADGFTAAACGVYFYARVIHFLAYTAGIVGLRTLCFFFGWAATMVIIARVLGWL